MFREQRKTLEYLTRPASSFSLVCISFSYVRAARVRLKVRLYKKCSVHFQEISLESFSGTRGKSVFVYDVLERLGKRGRGNCSLFANEGSYR